MQIVEKSIQVDAPPESVFNFILEPDNLIAIWPSLVEAKEQEKLPNGGNKFRWTYRMGGLRLEGVNEDIEVIPNQRIVAQTKEGIDSKFTWSFRPQVGGTTVHIRVDYTVPIPLIGRLAEAILVKMNEGEIEVMLTYLKARVEWQYNRIRER